MNPPVISRTRLAVGAVMATATLATAGMAGSLAVAQADKDAASAPEVREPVSGQSAPTVPARTTDDENEGESGKSHKQKTSTSGFGQARPAQHTTQTSQSRTKGS